MALHHRSSCSIASLTNLRMTILILFYLLTLQGPAVQWLSPNEHDFGDLAYNEPVTHYFEYQNEGDTPLVIDNVRPSCGCTVPDWSNTPTAPGDTAKLKVIFDAKKPGYFRKKIKVYFSQLRKAEILYIEGYVEE